MPQDFPAHLSFLPLYPQHKQGKHTLFLLTFSDSSGGRSQTSCLSRNKRVCGALDSCGPAALTSHLLSWVFFLSCIFQFSASTSAQWAMVMATGHRRSSPGGPYVTSGPRRISQPSSVWTLNTSWERHTQRETDSVHPADHICAYIWRQVCRRPGRWSVIVPFEVCFNYKYFSLSESQ